MKMKNRSLGIVVPLVFVLLILICRGAELYFIEKANVLQMFQKTILQFANFLIIMAIGMALVFVVLFLSAKIKKKVTVHDFN